MSNRLVRVDLSKVYYVKRNNPEYVSTFSSRHFPGTVFKPEYTPRQMLKFGVFGGAYFGCDPLKYDANGVWEQVGLFEGITCVNKIDPQLNRYGLLSGQSKQWWVDRGLITNLDSLGWFHWYCNFFYGRRHDDEDERQIKRWYAFRRHKAQVLQNPEQPRLKQKQALLQWAYSPAGKIR